MNELRGLAVELADLRAVPAADDGAELTLSVRFINETIRPVGTASSRHRLTLDGVSLGRAASDEPVGLPPQGSAIQEITLTVRPSVAARLREMQAAGVANYRLESDILTYAGEEKLRSRPSATGSVNLRNLGL